MNGRVRDYAREYARRIERGLATGLSRAAARGHPKKSKRGAETAKTADPKSKLEQALKSMKQGTALTKAAKEHHVSPERLRRYLHDNTKAQRKGRRWIIIDKRPRRFPVYSAGQLQAPMLKPPEATKASGYMRTVDRFLSTGDADVLAPFQHAGVTDLKRTFVPFETDPNTLYRLDAAGELSFPEIYKIVR